MSSPEFNGQAERGLRRPATGELSAPGPRCPPRSVASPSGPPPALLVIGYGNTLRRDDGVGPKVVEALAALQLPGVQTLICQQLSPEHADPISRADTVVFVDAAVDAPKGVQWRRLAPSASAQLMAHAADPRTILALARDVFGHTPCAWWLTIPAVAMGFGEDLSPVAQRGGAKAVALISALVRSRNLSTAAAP